MAVPMLGGTFAMNAFNLADTWYVSRLGTLPLAAMGFSMPLIMFLISMTRGLGLGGTAAVSHALGRSDTAGARRITTHAILLSVAVIVVISVGGLLTIDPIFRLLGAEGAVLPLIRDYMTIWYLGVVFMVMPMMAGDIIRATGDTVSPSLIMISSAGLNIALDPVLIFGLGSIPAMGIRGAALATLLTRALSFTAVLTVLHRKHRLIAFEVPRWPELWASWKEVLHIGLPSAFSTVLIPIAGGVLTFLVARHGEAAVAAVGAAGRLEMFAFMVPMALGVSLVPFVGQNAGAGRLDRVREAQLYSNAFAFGFGLFIAAMFWLFAEPLARLFSQDEAVITTLTRFLRIVPLGYGLNEVHRYSGFFLNGIRRPMHSFGVNVVRIVGLLLPLAFLAEHYYGLSGLFWSRVVSDVLAGLIGLVWSRAVLQRVMAAAAAR